MVFLYHLIGAVILLLQIQIATAVDSTLSLGDTTVNILGQSGKMSISINGEESQVSVDSVSEVDENGVKVGCSGSTKHCVNSFASQDFTFTAPAVDVAIGDTTASTIVFSSNIPTGVFAMTTMIINEDGSVENSVPGGSTETLTLHKGDCKFNIDLSAWTWCTGGCSGGTGTGAFIDVTVEIKGTNTDATWNSDDTVGTLGGSSVTLSKTILVDNVVTSMPTGYPLIGGNGNNKNTITFRFPKFTTSAGTYRS